jgi:MSHA biogenesis protein MshL
MIDIFKLSPSRRASVYYLAVVLGLIGGCSSDRPLRTPEVGAAIRAELPAVAAVKPVVVPPRISEALAEPAPPALALTPEPKLDLVVNNANAREVFLAIVADTRYSMLMHPDVTGTLSVTLRGVTVTQALESIRDVYGYDFKIDGRRIIIYAPTLQTRIFTINYPHSQRMGNSELRVAPGAGLQAGATTGVTTATSATSAATAVQRGEGSRVTTTSKTDFWSELTMAIQGLVGNGQGRNVVSSPQAGIMAVRAMPDELRQVDKFLKAAQIAVERQVMLEAKIVEVELRDGFQSGIDWSALKNNYTAKGVIGSIGGNTTSATSSNLLVRGVQPGLPGFSAGAALLPDGLSIPPAGSGMFGLALASDGFQAVLGFLETQGDLQILSSPRIATLNNQKAVLKVGVEDFFVTNFTPGIPVTTAAGGTSTAPPTPVLTPYFSGISLDVTPQIDDGINIMLHVHPSVTTVTEKIKTFASIGDQPMASSSINESDTLVRIQDGNIVAIGGLMQVESNRRSSGLPGSGDSPFFGTLFGNRANIGRKKEVIVLIKPTVIRSAQDWEAQTQRTRVALDDMDTARARVIRLDGTVDDSRSKNAVK